MNEQIWFTLRRSVSLLFVVIFFDATCAVGPDFVRPEIRVPSAWHSSNDGTNTTQDAADLSTWWNSFHDPVLSTLIQKASEGSPDLRIALSRIRQSRAVRGVTAAGLIPTISANASLSRGHTPSASPVTTNTNAAPSSSSNIASTSSYSSTSIPGVINRYREGLDASWQLDIFGGIRRGIEAADADLSASVEDAHDIQITLFAEIGVAYMNIRGYQRQIAIAKENLEAQIRTADITHKRYRAGFVNGLDAANADAQVSTTQSQIPALESAYLSAVYGLCVLTGEPPQTLALLFSEPTAIPSPLPEVPIGLPSDLIRRRPDIRRSEANLHAATARIGAATAELFPSFSLTGSVGYTATDKKMLGTPAARFWTVGPSISMPIFQIGRIRWNIEAANAAQEETLLGYQRTVISALGEVESALVIYANEKSHQKLLVDAVESNKRAVDLATRLYLAGRTDFLNVVTAQRSLFAAQDALAQSDRDLSIDLITLYKALGGGWKESERE